MASKIQIQKAQQGYIDRPVPATCGNCEHYTSEMAKLQSRWRGDYAEEKNKRCSIGGFVVKKLATCNLYAPKGVQQ